MEEKEIDDIHWRVRHGSEVVQAGKLVGYTDTDYFYWLCPKCGDILRLLDYDVMVDKKGNKYDDMLEPKAGKSFTVAFELHCISCGLVDCVKVSNMGWQGGKIYNTAAKKGIDERFRIQLEGVPDCQ